MNDKKAQAIIKQILNRFNKFKFPNIPNSQLKIKQVDNFFKQIKTIIKLVKSDIENIKSTFKQCDGYYHSPEKLVELENVCHSFVIEIFQQGIFDKELGEDRLTCIIELCLNCEEEKRYFILSLDKMYQAIILSEKEWLKEKKIYDKGNSIIEEKYVKILQSGFTNLLLTSTDKMPMEIDPITKTRTIKTFSQQVTLEIILNSFDIKLAQQETKLLAVMLQKLTVGESGLLSIHLTDLATRLGKFNIKKARESIQASLQNIRDIDLKVDGKDSKGKKLYFSSALCQRAQIKNSVVSFEFSNIVEDYLLNRCDPMSINNSLFQITCSKTKNPYAWAIGYKIHYQANHNRYKDGKENNVFSMSVKSLLELCEKAGLPSYKKVSESLHQVNQRIIEPVERELDLLMDKRIISKWHYEDKKGNLIQDYIEIENDNPESDPYSISKGIKYSEWKKRNVIIEMPEEYLKQIPNFNKKKVKKNSQKTGKK